MTGPEISPAPACDPYVTTFGTTVDGHVVRCQCGRSDVVWATPEEAERDRDAHARGEPDHGLEIGI